MLGTVKSTVQHPNITHYICQIVKCFSTSQNKDFYSSILLYSGGDGRNRVTIIFLLKNFATPSRASRAPTVRFLSLPKLKPPEADGFNFVSGDARNRTAVQMNETMWSTRCSLL